jgi:hypothetical protein
MAITERMLKKWRKEALITDAAADATISMYEGTATNLAKAYVAKNREVIRMTQELLDQHLLRKEGK